MLFKIPYSIPINAILTVGPNIMVGFLFLPETGDEIFDFILKPNLFDAFQEFGDATLSELLLNYNPGD